MFKGVEHRYRVITPEEITSAWSSTSRPETTLAEVEDWLDQLKADAVALEIADQWEPKPRAKVRQVFVDTVKAGPWQWQEPWP